LNGQGPGRQGGQKKKVMGADSGFLEKKAWGERPGGTRRGGVYEVILQREKKKKKTKNRMGVSSEGSAKTTSIKRTIAKKKRPFQSEKETTKKKTCDVAEICNNVDYLPRNESGADGKKKGRGGQEKGSPHRLIALEKHGGVFLMYVTG